MLNKRNSTAKAVRVEANLYGTSSACAFLKKIMNRNKMFDIDNEGQCHGVQHSPWYYSMANNNLYKVTLEHFSLALTVFEIFT